MLEDEIIIPHSVRYVSGVDILYSVQEINPLSVTI